MCCWLVEQSTAGDKRSSPSKHTGPSYEAMKQYLETAPFFVAESTPWRVVTCECEQRTTDPNDPSTCASPPACLKESDLGWCQRGEWSSPHGYTLTRYEKFQCHFASRVASSDESSSRPFVYNTSRCFMRSYAFIMVWARRSQVFCRA